MTKPLRLFLFTWEAKIRYAHGGTTKRQGKVLAANPNGAAHLAMQQLTSEMLGMPEDWINGMELGKLDLNLVQEPRPNGVAGVALQ